MTIESLLFVLQLQIVQIILLAFVGGLLGEIRREVDDTQDIVFTKFLVHWISSGFCGTMVALIVKGMLPKENEYIVLGTSGAAGFIGYKLSSKWAQNLLYTQAKAIVKATEDEDKDEE